MDYGTTPDNQYWAEKDAKDVANEVLKKAKRYYDVLRESGRLDLWRRSYFAYYRSAMNGGRIGAAGDTGELSTMTVNHFRNLLLHLKNFTTQQRPAYDPRAINTDYKSQAECILAKGLLENYLVEKNLESVMVEAAEKALIFAEGFVRTEWDENLGDVHGIDGEGNPAKKGDLTYTALSPLDVIRDHTKTSTQTQEWVVVRSFRNKYSLAAKYPALREKILAISTTYSDWKDTQFFLMSTDTKTDDIPVYELYHDKTAVLPNGRYMLLASPDVVFIDAELSYRRIPVRRICPAEQLETIFGYTIGYDLLPIQEAIDGLYSTILTNQKTFGVQMLLEPRGSNIGLAELSKGLSVISYDPQLGKPEPLQLTSTPPEIFNFLQMLEQVAETISGINSVARGNPEASLKSGAALALVQSMAVQFSQSFQRSWVYLLEGVGTDTINNLQDFAESPRIALIVGKSNRSYLKEYSKKDLLNVGRVIVGVGNPMATTTAGRMELAKFYMDAKLIENPDQITAVLDTGTFTPVIEARRAQLMLIRAENEGLAEGQQMTALAIDRHAQHILEHAVVLASPEARENPEIIANVSVHIQQHIDLLANTNPALLHFLGQQSTAMTPGPIDAPGSQTKPQTPDAPEGPDMPSLPNPPQGTDPASAAAIESQQV
jgi:hypothetical protein